jgi:hypothetical protein
MTSLTSVFSSSLRVQLLQVFLHQSLLKAIYGMCQDANKDIHVPTVHDPTCTYRMYTGIYSMYVCMFVIVCVFVCLSMFVCVYASLSNPNLLIYPVLCNASIYNYLCTLWWCRRLQ